MIPRPATLDDAPFVAAIYNEGIEDRVATFETRARSEEDVRAWFNGRHPIVVVEEQGQIVAFASTSTYRPRDCYAGENQASLALIGSLGFREVGIYEKHGQLDGVWRDVVIVERHLLA
jgi:phosphinothricin acetyltransferase